MTKRAVPAQFFYMTGKHWIVVGTDFSDGARCALLSALSLAESSGAGVALVHAYEDQAGTERGEDPTARILGQLAEEIAACGAARRGIRVEPLVRRGPPWNKILNVATEYGADFVAVGATGQRGAEAGFPLGGVTSRILALSARSVFVARPGF
jgi:nucleotide-binding universal stress UspA family protein